MPGGAHWLVDQAIGALVVDELLLDGIELEIPSQLDSGLGEIDDGAGAMAVLLIECELLPLPDRFVEVGHLRFRVRERGQLAFDIGDVRKLYDHRTKQPITEDQIARAVARINQHKINQNEQPMSYKAAVAMSGGTPCPECGSSNYFQIGTCMQCRDCFYHTGCG